MTAITDPPAKTLMAWIRPCTLMCILLLLVGCQNSTDQKAFEAEALRPAENFTETAQNGEVLSDDSDDWRISPFFGGLVEVRPAYPNPVQTTDQLFLEVRVTGIDAVYGLDVMVYYPDGSVKVLYEDFQSPLPTGLSVIPINPLLLGRFNTVESARDLHRMILTDASGTIISYGDVRVL